MVNGPNLGGCNCCGFGCPNYPLFNDEPPETIDIALSGNTPAIGEDANTYSRDIAVWSAANLTLSLLHTGITYDDDRLVPPFETSPCSGDECGTDCWIGYEYGQVIASCTGLPTPYCTSCADWYMPGGPPATLFSSDGSVFYHAGIRFSRANDGHVYLSAFLNSYATFCDYSTIFACGARTNCLDLGAGPIDFPSSTDIDLECWIGYGGGFYGVSSSPTTPDSGTVGTLTITT